MTLLAAAPQPETLILDVLVILATAAVVAIVMQRLRMAVIPAYLVAGAVAGPGAFALVRSSESLESIAQLAIVLLMFGIGLHLHLAALGHSVARMIAMGVASCIVSIVLGWPIALAFGLTQPAAIAVCMALSLSSTAVVLRLIADRGELRHNTGRLALAVLVVQDLVVLPMLAAIPLLARWAHGSAEDLVEVPAGTFGEFALKALLRVGGITALIVLGKVVLPRVLKEAARERTGEVMMIVSVAVAIGAGVATHAMGFSMELGAFLAGFLLAATPFRHQLTGQIAPLRDLFMAVFFTTLGMQLDPQSLLESWWILLIGGAIMTAVKVISIGGVSWLLGATPQMALAVGFALAQGGEFGLMLIDAAQTEGILSETAGDNVIAIIVVSLILTPGLVDLGRRLSHRYASLSCAPWIRTGLQAAAAEHAAPEGARVILGGYGQVGSAVARALDEAGIPCTIIEVNPDVVNRAQRESIVLGDVSNQWVLADAGLARASALLLTMPDEQAVLAACAIARRQRPDIFIVVRIGMARHEQAARQLGADLVVVEELEAARAMQGPVLARLRDRGR